MFLLGSLALIVAGSIFWSCQKDEILMNPDGVMLKNALIGLDDCDDGCITTIQQYQSDLIKGVGVDVGDIQVHNTKQNLIVKVISDDYVASIRVTINDVEYYYDKEKDPVASTNVTYSEPSTVAPNKGKILRMTVTLPLAANVSCTEFKIDVEVDGGGKAEVIYKQYEWCEDCEIREETAFGGDISVGVNEPGNWYYYLTAELDGTGQAKVWAGQDEEIGTVVLSGGIINITLNGDWKLKDGEAESVKVQGLNDIPTSRLQGNEYSYKGTSLTDIDAGAYPFYMIHLDVEICE